MNAEYITETLDRMGLDAAARREVVRIVERFMKAKSVWGSSDVTDGELALIATAYSIVMEVMEKKHGKRV